MEINGYWLAGSIVALIMVFEVVMNFDSNKHELNEEIWPFLFLVILAVIFMGLAF